MREEKLEVRRALFANDGDLTKKYVLQSIIAPPGQLWAEGGAPSVACSVETGWNTFTPTNNSNARLSSFPSRKNLEVGYCCIGGS